jgi:hypothetical protein
MRRWPGRVEAVVMRVHPFQPPPDDPPPDSPSDEGDDWDEYDDELSWQW